MSLENVVMQARDPLVTGRFWAAALGLTELTATDALYEARLDLGGDVWLDICIERVATSPPPSPRLHLDLLGGGHQSEIVDRLIGLGARHLDIGQHEGGVPWIVLADPDDNPFCVMEERAAYSGTGPIAALPLQSADPERDAALYAALTGWVRSAGVAPVSLRHPSGRGPLLELCDEPAPKNGQNRLHLDVRPERGGPTQGELVDLALGLGATRAEENWAQGHAWIVLHDSSGNELCVLPDAVRVCGLSS